MDQHPMKLFSRILFTAAGASMAFGIGVKTAANTGSASLGGLAFFVFLLAYLFVFRSKI